MLEIKNKEKELNIFICINIDIIFIHFLSNLFIINIIKDKEIETFDSGKEIVENIENEETTGDNDNKDNTVIHSFK